MLWHLLKFLLFLFTKQQNSHIFHVLPMESNCQNSETDFQHIKGQRYRDNEQERINICKYIKTFA